MKQNMIEEYYVENGQSKVIMTPETARDIHFAISGFSAGQIKAQGKVYKIELSKYIIQCFLADEKAKDYLDTASDGLKVYQKLDQFITAVKSKVAELLSSQ